MTQGKEEKLANRIHAQMAGVRTVKTEPSGGGQGLVGVQLLDCLRVQPWLAPQTTCGIHRLLLSLGPGACVPLERAVPRNVKAAFPEGSQFQPLVELLKKRRDQRLLSEECRKGS